MSDPIGRPSALFEQIPLKPKSSPQATVTQAPLKRPSLLLHPRAVEHLGLSSEQLGRLHSILDESGDESNQELMSRLKTVSSSSPVTGTEQTAQRALDVL